MSDEHKAEPVSPSAILPPAKNSFASMRSAEDISTMIRSAPPVHQDYTARLQAAGQSLAAREEYVTVPKQKLLFKTGARVQHNDGRKYTIIAAAVGYTKKTNTKVHRVADKHGNTKDLKESELKVFY